MRTSTVSSREYNQNFSSVSRLAKEHPVIITVRGDPELVVLSYQDFQKMQNQKVKRCLLDSLQMPELSQVDPDFDFEACSSHEPAKFEELD